MGFTYIVAWLAVPQNLSTSKKLANNELSAEPRFSLDNVTMNELSTASGPTENNPFFGKTIGNGCQ